jgi:hypothetical protein
MGGDAHDKRPRRLTRSLSGIKSEYKKLCDELGGPADVGLTIDKRNLETYCREYRVGQVLPILIQFQDDDVKARRHWPWAAFALSHYKFEHQERQQYADEPRPKEILELLAAIQQSAHDLCSALSRLEELSNRLADPTAPLRRPHLGWLDALISQAAVGSLSNEVEDDAQALLGVHFRKMSFLKRLVDIEVAAKTALQRADATLLERERGQAEPALPNFVLRCAVIWKSLTGREPSANKVARREGPDDPDFVVFMQELAGLGQVSLPTRAKVAASLRKMTPSIRAALSSKSEV